MNLTWIDWAIVLALFAFMVSGVLVSRKLMRSVADFLSAGRTAGRYLVSVAEGIAALGAITVVANFQMNYNAGFPMAWWNMTMGIFVLVVTASGWVRYRFRETRALTMQQFFQQRYSKNFRIFAGILAFFSGLINFGIFPSVGARFFIYFCGLPASFQFLGLDISTYAFSMIVLIGVSVFFVFAGGQIAVMVADFIQGTFVNIIFIIIVIFFFTKFNFTQIYEALSTAPENASLINPFKTSQAADFNLWFFLIGVSIVFYNTLSWQGTQGYNSSAKSAHEFKMGAVLSNWRNMPQVIFMLLIPIVAYTVLHHADFFTEANFVNGVLKTVDNPEIQNQLRVPLVLTKFLPVGLMGAFVAVMVGAFISTHDTYLHSWASIFIQDVVMPLRKKPLSAKAHINLLRAAIIGVAIFIFLFSLLFKQTDYIMMFFAITAAIFAGGSGAVIIGGLYWKRGTTTAAWTAMIVGASVSISGIILQQVIKNFPINGQVMTFIAMLSAVLSYVIVSLLSRKEPINLDKLLKRGRYRIKADHAHETYKEQRGLKLLGIGKEFSFWDKSIYIATYTWIFGWFMVFIIGTILNLILKPSDLAWMKFWYVYLTIFVVAAIVVVVWFTLGGLKDIKYMFKRLRTMERDDRDDGRVVE